MTAVIFLVDSTDKKRFEESKQQLDNLLLYEGLKNVPFLILGNKIDKADAVSEQDLRYALGLLNTTGKVYATRFRNLRPIELFMCSVTQKQGYEEGFRWIAQYV